MGDIVVTRDLTKKNGMNGDVITVDTDPSATVTHAGYNEYVVSDQHGSSDSDFDSGFPHLTEDFMHQLGQISTWFSEHSFFFNSKNDLEAARQANKYLQ